MSIRRFPTLWSALLAYALASECGIQKADLFYVQDQSPRFQKLFPQIANHINEFLAAFENTYANSAYGFGTFSDKEISGNGVTLGLDDDHCLKEKGEIGNIAKSKIAKRLNEWAEDWMKGDMEVGGDFPQATFDALVRATLSQKPGWRNGAHRLIAVVTDAISHQRGDVLSLTGQQVSNEELTADLLNRNGLDEWCNFREYSGIDQLKTVSDQYDTQYLILAVTPQQSETYMKEHTEAKYQGDDGIALWYEDQFNAAGINGFTERVSADLSDLLPALERGIARWDAWLCNGDAPKPITSTASPLSTKPSTALSTTAVTTTGKSGQKCALPFDVLHLQDQGPTFQKKYIELSTHIGRLTGALKSFNYQSRYAIATFSDKDLSGNGYTLGQDDDHCLKEMGSLGDMADGQIIKKLKEWGLKQDRDVGGDFPQATWEALNRAVISGRPGWAAPGQSNRVVLVVTDAISHNAGDVQALTGKSVKANYVTSDLIEQEGLNTWCDFMDYPTMDQVKSAVKDSSADVVVLAVRSGTYSNGNYIPSSDMAKLDAKYHGEDGLALWYKDQMPELIVESVSSDLHDFSTSFLKALEQLIHLRCEGGQPTPLPTTTTEPITVGPTPYTSSKTVGPTPYTSSKTVGPTPYTSSKTVGPTPYTSSGIETTTVPTVGPVPTPETSTVPTTTTTEPTTEVETVDSSASLPTVGPVPTPDTTSTETQTVGPTPYTSSGIETTTITKTGEPVTFTKTGEPVTITKTGEPVTITKTGEPVTITKTGAPLTTKMGESTTLTVGPIPTTPIPTVGPIPTTKAGPTKFTENCEGECNMHIEVDIHGGCK